MLFQSGRIRRVSNQRLPKPASNIAQGIQGSCFGSNSQLFPRWRSFEMWLSDNVGSEPTSQGVWTESLNYGLFSAVLVFFFKTQAKTTTTKNRLFHLPAQMKGPGNEVGNNSVVPNPSPPRKNITSNNEQTTRSGLLTKTLNFIRPCI